MYLCHLFNWNMNSEFSKHTPIQIRLYHVAGFKFWGWLWINPDLAFPKNKAGPYWLNSRYAAHLGKALYQVLQGLPRRWGHSLAPTGFPVVGGSCNIKNVGLTGGLAFCSQKSRDHIGWGGCRLEKPVGAQGGSAANWEAQDVSCPWDWIPLKWYGDWTHGKGDILD